MLLVLGRFFKAVTCLVKYQAIHTWRKPKGYDTGIKIYNCRTRNKEPLIVRNKNLINWYTCGPTVYDSSHIGHASCYVKLDILQKILQNYFKYNLVTVMNITDIDDKIILKANQKELSCANVSKMYEKEFFEDLNKVGIAKPNIVLRVTENIDIIIDFIKQLEETGRAYKAKNNSVYFLVENNNYGKLVNIGKASIEQKKSSVKKNEMDFALWKSSKGGEPFWVSPWGEGRPGWHTECSALASHVLGSNIDIHAGGMDLKFPHHENEEAQSCAFHGTDQWINYWVHVGHLHLKSSEKMSKSLRNTISIQEMLNENKVDVFRLACAMSHYRSNMEYSKALLETAKNLYEVYKNFIITCDDYKKGHLKGTINSSVLLKTLSDSYNKIHEAFCDDFDTPGVINTLNELVSTTNSMIYTTSSTDQQTGLGSVTAVSKFMLNILSLFGVNFGDTVSSNSEDFTEIMNIFNNFRQEVRLIAMENKDKHMLEICDDVRTKLKENNIVVRDYGKKSSWSR